MSRLRTSLITSSFDFIRGFIYDVCDDAHGMLEAVIDLMPDEWEFLEYSLEFGIDQLCLIKGWVDGETSLV